VKNAEKFPSNINRAHVSLYLFELKKKQTTKKTNKQTNKKKTQTNKQTKNRKF
jgi:hypothetical protein